MANDYSGMFSFKTPDQIREEAMSGIRIPNTAMASQGLLQQGVSMMRNAGAGIGMGVAEAMGRQLPEVQKQEKIKAVLSRVAHLADPLTQAQMAYQLFTADGMVEEAQKAMGTIRQLQDERLGEKERLAKMENDRAKANKPSAEKEFIQITNFLADLDASIGKGVKPEAADLNKARLYIGKLSKSPKTYIDRETQDLITIPGYDAAASVPNLFKLLNQGAATGAADTAGVGGTGQGEMTVTQTPGAKKLEETARFALESNISDQNTALQNIKAIEDMKGAGTGWETLWSWLPNSDSMATAGLVNTLKSEAGLGELEKLKSMSPTGASGMGATNAQEVSMLQGRIRTLNPANKVQFAKDIQFIKEKWQAILERYKKKLEELDRKQRGGQASAGQPAPTPAPAPAASQGASVREKWMRWGRKTYPNKTDAEIEAALRKAGKIQ